eukprot:COSAG04_NODE_15541_length_528_cov_1.902098_1_plen_81_part_00
MIGGMTCIKVPKAMPMAMPWANSAIASAQAHKPQIDADSADLRSADSSELRSADSESSFTDFFNQYEMVITYRWVLRFYA